MSLYNSNRLHITVISHLGGCSSNLFTHHTVKLEMFADINVCEFCILTYFSLLKFAILGLSKVKIVSCTMIHWVNSGLHHIGLHVQVMYML